MKYKYNFYYLIIGLIFLISFFVRIYYIHQKDGLTEDEVLTVVLSEYNEPGWYDHIPEGTYTGKQLKNIILFNDPSVKGCISDVAKLWLNNRDQPHTNFYYSLFRISALGLNSTDIRAIVYRGCGLNLILFSFAFFVMLLLLS